MEDTVRQGEFFSALDDATVARLEPLCQARELRKGEYLFLLGQNADRIYVVQSGSLSTCLPLSFGGSVKDVCVELKPPGSALGWSALVRPHRFTLSARAAESSEVVELPRSRLEELFAADAILAHVFTRQVAAVVGRRLLTMQALWTRELQRAMDEGRGPRTERRPAPRETHA